MLIHSTILKKVTISLHKYTKGLGFSYTVQVRVHAAKGAQGRTMQYRESSKTRADGVYRFLVARHSEIEGYDKET